MHQASLLPTPKSRVAPIRFFLFFLFFLFPLLYSLKLLIFAKSLVMGERYDIGIDIGEGRDWWYVHGRTTHDKVYELNRQMCDIDKHLSEAGYFRMICDGQIEARKKLTDMEEKKTKKMTKAEAFEWLKHKKVAVTGDTITLQNKLFNIGYKWCDGSIVAMPMIDFLFIDDETFQFTESLSHFRNCGYTEISANDILSVEIVEEKYELEFNYDKAVELAKPLMHYLSETGHTEVISVCQEGISAIPMGVFLYKG